MNQQNKVGKTFFSDISQKKIFEWLINICKSDHYN